MFLDTVIFVLQEILEASLLISMLLVLATNLRVLWPERFLRLDDWLPYALGWGIAGAALYGWYMPSTSAWFGYAGYEVINAFLQGLMIAVLGLCCMTLRLTGALPLNLRLARGCMIVVVICGIVREGSEIMLYLQGLISQPENLTPVLLGTLTATGIGISSGLLLYFLLCSVPPLIALRTSLALLALFAGNMAAQAVQLLTQAGWLPDTVQVWNSAALLSEDSLTGRVLYTLVGYEANPSLAQLLAYLAAVLVIAQSALFRHAWLILSNASSVSPRS